MSLDLDAEHYLKNSTIQHDRIRKFLTGYVFHPEARVLDVGCGDGRITAEIAERIPRGSVIGADLSPNMISLAQKSFSNVPNLEFRLENAEGLLLSGRFNVILCLNCLHWVKQPQKALRRMAELLEIGGELLILTYPKESPYYQFLEEALASFPDYQACSAYRTLLHSGEYAEILQENGLEFREYALEETTVCYQDGQVLKDYIRGWLTCYAPISEDLQESFLDLAVKKALLMNQAKGSIELPCKILFMKLTR